MLFKVSLYVFAGLALAACQTTQPNDTVQQAPPQATAAQTAAPTTEVQVASAGPAAGTEAVASDVAAPVVAAGTYTPQVGAKFHDTTSRNGDSVWEYKGVINNLHVMERTKGRHVGDIVKYNPNWDLVAFESEKFTDRYYRPSIRGLTLPLVPGASFSHTYKDNRGRNDSERTNVINCTIGDYQTTSVTGLSAPLKTVELDCAFDSNQSGRAYKFRDVRVADNGLQLFFESWRTSNPNQRDYSRIVRIEP